MKEYARQRALKRWMIPVPVLSPRLSSLWLGLVTPVYARVGRELVDSLRNETVVRDRSAADLFSIRPLGSREALTRALANEDREFAETRWSDAFSSVAASPHWGGTTFGRRMVDSRSARVSFSAAVAFRPIDRLGGKTGWYYGNWLWRIRGWLDLLFGGAGMRRGRRVPDFSSQATPLISGGSKKSNATIWSGCLRKCVCLDERGYSLRWNRPVQDRSFARLPSSTPRGCSDRSTGTSYIRSTN